MHRPLWDTPQATGRPIMMTLSNGNILRVTDPLCGEFTKDKWRGRCFHWMASSWLVAGEFPSHRPVTQSFEIFCDPRLNKRLSKQSWGLWFETPSIPSWRHCNDCALKLCENLAVGGWTWLKWLISNGGIPWRGIKVEKCTLTYNDIIQIIFQQN